MSSTTTNDDPARPIDGTNSLSDNDYLWGATTAVPSPSVSTSRPDGIRIGTEYVGTSPLKQKNAFLDIPSTAPPPRRPSIQSTYSDFSELPYHPGVPHEPLMWTESNTAYQEDHRSPLMRRLHNLWITNYGAFLVLLAQFFGSVMNLATRLLETAGEHGTPMHPFQILLARQGITAAVCITYGVYSKSIPHFPFGAKGIRWLLVLRGLGGFFGVFGLYFSLLYLPLSEATVMTFLGPILTCYVCSLALTGESFTKQQQLAGFVSLAGVVLIARPHTLLKLFFTADDDHNESSHTSNSTMTATSSEAEDPHGVTASQHLSAIGISLIGVLGATVAMTSIRAIGTRAHPFISINYFSVWCTIVSLASLAIFPDVKFRLPGNWTEWGLLFSLGACGFVMQWLLTEGLAYGSSSNAKTETIERTDVESGRKVRTEPTSKNRVIKGAGTRATSMVYTQMLFALAGDKVVFGVVPTALSWLGSGLILAGAVWVAAARDQGDESTSTPGSSVVSRGMELNTVAVDAVGFGRVDLSSASEQRVDDEARQETVGLMADMDENSNDQAESSSRTSSTGSPDMEISHTSYNSR